MSAYRFLPLHECDVLRKVQASTSGNAGESCAIIGDNSLLRSSFLFQSALSMASEGDQVVFIRPGPWEQQQPYHVFGTTENSAYHLQCIKMVYLSDPSDLLKYLCDFHTKDFLPAAIMVDDIQFYVSHLPQDQTKETAMVKLFAVLEDTAAYISQKKGEESCHRQISLARGACPKNFIKRYFRELWHISVDESGQQGFLTDDHMPAFRAQFHLDNHDREIVADKVYRLES